jgi:fructokinase
VLRIGIDLGGTKIEGIVLDVKGSELYRKRIPTHSERGYEAILAGIAGLYRDMTSRIGGSPHTLGIGTPGAISLKTGLLKNSNTVCMIGKPLKTDIERVLGRSLAIQNDANCFAEAEALLGAGRGKDLVFGVIIGTGCGGGIVYKGHVLTGIHAIAGEWGHTSMDPNGPVCYCGARGCVETYISGGGFEKRYAERYGERKNAGQIVEDSRAGDPRALAMMEAYYGWFGRAVANLINILDPDIIVLGGGMSKTDEIYTHGVKAVAEKIFSDGLDTPIVRHQLGDSAGVIGAAMIGV